MVHTRIRQSNEATQSEKSARWEKCGGDAAYSPHAGTRLVLQDFAVSGLSGELFRSVGARLREAWRSSRSPMPSDRLVFAVFF
jgi:hypothetical protein